jgi:ubiquitin carboxyl-terminal hydrolase 4/11/15
MIHEYDNGAEASEDEVTESGEDQGLVANSSPRGSSSALTGVGAAHRQQNLGSDMTINPQDLDKPPTYNVDGWTAGDTEMSDGFTLRNSIEDEGIDMGEYNNLPTFGPNPLSEALRPRSGFSFSNLDGLADLSAQQNHISGTGSPTDYAARSDAVHNSSSASSGSRERRVDEWNDTMAEDDEGVPFVDPSPVPDIDDENQIDPYMLHQMIKPSFQVPAGAVDDDIEEPATEIHVEEGEGLVE